MMGNKIIKIKHWKIVFISILIVLIFELSMNTVFWRADTVAPARWEPGPGPGEAG